MKKIKIIISAAVLCGLLYLVLIIAGLSLISDFESYLGDYSADAEKEFLNLNEEQTKRIRTAALLQADDILNRIDLIFSEIKADLTFVSEIVKDAYKKDLISPPLPIRHYNDFQFPSRFDDIIFSQNHSHNVSFDFMSYKFYGRENRQKLLGYVPKISALNEFLRHFYDSRRGILWMYIILDEGILFQYPGSGNFPEDGNFKAEHWYKTTAELKEFNATYGADNIYFSVPVIENETYLGAVSFAVKPSEIFKDYEVLILHEQYGVLFNNTEADIQNLRDLGRENTAKLFSGDSGVLRADFNNKMYDILFRTNRNIFFKMCLLLNEADYEIEFDFIKSNKNITDGFKELAKKYLIYSTAAFIFIFIVFLPVFVFIDKKSGIS